MAKTVPPAYSVTKFSRNESVGYLIGELRARLINALDTELTPLGLTATQWTTLARLQEGDTITAAELCRRAGCDTGAMTRMLDRLEEKGLVDRERSVDDRRVYILSITEAGHALLNEALPSVVNVLNRHLTGFTAAELKQLKGFLRRMIANGSATPPEGENTSS